jgi:hypothetical protein
VKVTLEPDVSTISGGPTVEPDTSSSGATTATCKYAPQTLDWKDAEDERRHAILDGFKSLYLGQLKAAMGLEFDIKQLRQQVENLKKIRDAAVESKTEALKHAHKEVERLDGEVGRARRCLRNVLAYLQSTRKTGRKKEVMAMIGRALEDKP